MTRRILSTAALAAFLASGHPLIIPAGERTAERRTAASGQLHHQRCNVLDLDGRLVAVEVAQRSATALDIALQLEGTPTPVRLWTGPKNAWGSTVALAEAQDDQPGFLRATVAVRPGSERLWIGLDRDGLRPAIAALRLDAMPI